MIRKSILSILILFIGILVFAQDTHYKWEKDLPYQDETLVRNDEYIRERCVLDVYYPEDSKDFATLVWFHGGGLTGGDKYIPEGLLEQGIAVVSVRYRLYPKIKAAVYTEDAAAAVAWVFKNIGKYGGDTEKIFISGHSAGAYLTSMLGLDKKYLAAYGVDADDIAGLIPLSGHTITHFTVRDERGIEGTQAVVDSLAPLFHVRADAPPILFITGDRELEMLGRYEENAYMWRMMKVVGHQESRIFELDGYGHNIVAPSCPLIINEISRILKNNTLQLP